MTPIESIKAKDLGSAHLNVAAFLMEIDARHSMDTVPQVDREAVEQARRAKLAQNTRSLGGLGVNALETVIL